MPLVIGSNSIHKFHVSGEGVSTNSVCFVTDNGEGLTRILNRREVMKMRKNWLLLGMGILGVLLLTVGCLYYLYQSAGQCHEAAGTRGRCPVCRQ